MLHVSAMTKKRNWLCFIKKLFFQDTHSHQQHKCKRRRWLFGRLKRTTKGLPSPNAEAVKTVLPVTDVAKTTDFEERLNKSDEEVRKSITVCENEAPVCRDIVTDDASIFTFSAMLKSHVQHQAATKIQTAYRGHLARKALRAIKGFVTLQAIIRGRAVRRQAATTLKCLQSIVSIQSEICARRSIMSRSKSRDLLSQDVRNEKPRTTKIQLSRDRRSDCGLPTKYEETDTILRKKEPTLRSQRIKANSFNHRKSTDSSEEGVTNGRLKYWIKQYVNDQLHIKDEKIREKHPKVRTTDVHHNYDNISGPRRSLQNHRKQTSCTEDGFHPSSPSNLPPYMAATKSAKAKTRSLSSPRLRPMHFDAYSDGDSPYKHKLSPMSSINSEVTGSSFSKVSHKSFYPSSQQKSPSLKGVSGPVRSNKTIDDIRLDSERLHLNKG